MAALSWVMDDLATIIGTKKVERSTNKYKEQTWREADKVRAIVQSLRIQR